MKDLHQLVDYAIPLYCDNQLEISFAENSIFHARIKLVELNYHFIMKKILQVEIEIRYVKTDNIALELFTNVSVLGSLKSFASSLRFKR